MHTYKHAIYCLFVHLKQVDRGYANSFFLLTYFLGRSFSKKNPVHLHTHKQRLDHLLLFFIYINSCLIFVCISKVMT